MDNHSGLRARLANWSRWAWRRAPQGHCLSIEHRYRAPRCWDEPQPALLVDDIDAYRVESAWRTLPLQDRVALKWHWVMGWGARVRHWKMTAYNYERGMARKLAVHSGAVRETVYLAEKNIKNQLTAPDGVDNIATKFEN